ncbi:MAG: DNA repair protein RecN [Firmicutes bacterium]|nr:DNA repair protein RecN [Bacillota bacterium]
MLLELHVENFALIDEVSLPLQPGLNVLTGETGAGKSILIDALALLLGARANADLIRTGKEAAVVEAAFAVAPSSPVWAALAELGVEADPQGPDPLLVSRELSRSGRNRCRINGRMVTVPALGEVIGHLVDLHAQHEHQSLLQPSRQRALLDAFAGEPVLKLARQVAGLYEEMRTKEEDLRNRRQREADVARQLDLLEYQAREIASARLQPGEDEELEAERRLLRNAGQAAALGDRVHRLLAGGEGGGEEAGALNLLGQASADVQRLLTLAPSLAEAGRLLESAQIEVAEAARQVADFLSRLEADPARLNAVEERLADLAELKRKYGPSLPEVLEYARKIQHELEDLRHFDENLAASQAEVERLRQEWLHLALQLSEARREAARRLEAALSRELPDLALASARLLVQVSYEEDAGGLPGPDGRRLRPGSHGVDSVEFLFTANPGEPPRPLGRVASGGELSRLMLALKTVLAQVDQVPTLIFDEIDTGISGRTAQAVAEKLARLSRRRQVICVTHLPQIACMSDRHFCLEKTTEAGTTRTRARLLEGEERIGELARMLGGARVTETTRQHAREMVAMAEQVKGSPAGHTQT